MTREPGFEKRETTIIAPPTATAFGAIIRIANLRAHVAVHPRVATVIVREATGAVPTGLAFSRGQIGTVNKGLDKGGFAGRGLGVAKDICLSFSFRRTAPD